MAQIGYFTPYGGLQVKVDTEYSKDNIPAQADVVVLTRGVRIYDETDSKTPLRGVRVLVTTTGLTAPVTPLPNIPIVWYEGRDFVFSVDSTYKFLDKGIVAYGKRIVV